MIDRFVIVIFAMLIFIVPWTKTEPYVWNEPFQCHLGCTMLPGDYPEHYGCTEFHYKGKR